VVANGVEYAVDCIIYASGFEISTAFKRRVGFEIFGRDGLSLYDYYKDGFRTLHGHSSRNFPNWFYIGIGQNGLSVNMTAMFDDQARHIAYIIQQAKARGAIAVEPTEEAEEAWVEVIRSVAILNRDFQNACTPGYYNNEGGERSGGLNGQTYTPGINKFNALLAEWREQGEMQGIELHYE
jgi:cyclohexanone monooxygenase